MAGDMVLFVCGGNTCRSPMAMAIARDEIARGAGSRHLRAGSGGVSVRPAGAPLSAEAAIALRELDVEPPPGHEAREVTAEMCAGSAVIYCMTRGQRDMVVALAPDAAARTYCLDPEADIPDPIGKPVDAYRRCAADLRRLVRIRLRELRDGYAPAGSAGG